MQRGSLKEQDLSAPRRAKPDHDAAVQQDNLAVGTLNGKVHDGDTFQLATGGNARLFGADAWELNQTGRTRAGEVVPLGQNARRSLLGQLPDAVPTFTGDETYGRPVASLSGPSGDVGRNLICNGDTLAILNATAITQER